MRFTPLLPPSTRHCAEGQFLSLAVNVLSGAALRALRQIAIAALLVSGSAWLGSARAALVGSWTADTYVSGTNWTGSNGVVATRQGSPTAVANAFGSHKGVDLSGGRYFTLTGAQNPIGGKSSFTLAAVFRPTAAGAAGAPWYSASGLIGMEQGGVVSDFGLGWSGDGGGQVKAGVGLSSGDQTVTSPTVPINATQVAVFTYNGSTGVLTLFVNGQQVAAGSGSVSPARNAGAMALGAMTSAGGNPFPGLVAELRMYDTVEDGAALSAALRATYVPPKLITSFTTNKANAYEGEAVQLAWTIDTAPTNGNISVTVTRGTTTVYSGAAANGSVTTNLPGLAATAQPVTYTLTVAENGGNSYTNTADVSVSGDPGIPVAASQSGLTTSGTTPKAIALAASDPNGGTLAYSVTTPPTSGVLSGTPPNLTYTANAGFVGEDSFSFKVNDGSYDSAPALVTIVIGAEPAPPSAVTLGSSQVSTTAVNGTFIVNLSSADINRGETHTYTLVNGVGSSDNGRFTIVGHQLRAAQSFAGLAGSAFQIRVRSTDSSGLFTEQTFALTAAAPVRGVVINEILFNGVDNTLLTDFIELYNSGSSTVSLAGWRLSGGIDYLFPGGTSIPAGGYLLVAENPAAIQTRWGKSALGPWVGGLSSDGETVRLRDGANVIVSLVDYKPGFPWPIAADGKGTSMELINPALDASLGSSWRSAIIPAAAATTDTASPGAQNLQFAANAAPNIRQVSPSATQPAGSTPFSITARVTDPEGVATVSLQYQIVAPGSFIPATLPNTIISNNMATTPLRANPAFENAANWTAVAMNDDGAGADLQDGDSIYSATIPGQPHRTLVRYRVIVTDNSGASIRAPYADDESLNFACFVYNGVPAYLNTSAVTLQTLPVYHFLTRKADYDECVAYDATKQLNAQAARSFENWEAAFVYEGVVYDHVKYRLHGGNGRYAFTGKRAFRFFFNTGYDFQGKDNDGNPYPTTWNSLTTENCWENRGTYTFSLNEVVNFHLWNQLGVPSPLGNWGHFRTITTSAEQADQWHGDFWGLIYIHEDYDARFLDAHDLPAGNLYKLTRDPTDGPTQQRYQAPFAVKNGSDHGNIFNNLKGSSSPAFINAHVNLERWSRYHALAEAVRHYDYWPSGDNNAAYYFEPVYTAANGNRGRLWILPNDVDATWGPTWNNGHDIVHNALFNDTASAGGDSATNPTLWPQYFNTVREVRDLLWQTDQLYPLLAEFAAIIAPFEAADAARWKNAPADAGNHNGLSGAGMTSLATLVQDMKNFAFVGGSWPGANVGTGGRAAYLDALQTGVGNSEGSQLPATPTITFVGAAGRPVNDLRFTSSAFSDPQGAGTFAAAQWRVAEITDPTSPAYVTGEKFKLEWNATFDSGEIASLAGAFRFPAASARPGHTYRARVRHKDATGRWSHWSAPAQFSATAADVNVYKASLVVSEVMYHPTPPTAQEQALGYTEESFEYLEVRNVNATSVDLTDVRFTKGVDFDFPPGLMLPPGSSTLIVANAAAFNSRYGSGKTIAGVWEAGDFLSNEGEQIKLSFGAGESIVEFVFDDVAPWPTEADTLGYSLVLVAPETRPNPTLSQSWRSSRTAGGNPGADDRLTFSTWAAGYPGSDDPNADVDLDGLTSLAEYAMGGDPRSNDPGAQPEVSVQAISVGGIEADYLTISFRRQIGAEDVRLRAQFSIDLTNWSEDGVLTASVPNSDGTRTETWRAAARADGLGKQFARVRVTSP